LGNIDGDGSAIKRSVNTGSSISYLKNCEMPIKVVIANDHPPQLGGFIEKINESSNIEIVGNVKTDQELSDLLEQKETDIVLIGFDKHTQINGSKIILKLTKFSGIKKLIIHYEDHQQTVINLFKRRVNGFLLKSDDKQKVVEAINTVHSGGRYASNDIIEKLKPFDAQWLKEIPEGGLSPEYFYRRELEILQLMIKGHNITEISEALFLSKQTVRDHEDNLIRKTGSTNMADLFKYAIRNGFLKT